MVSAKNILFRCYSDIIDFPAEDQTILNFVFCIYLMDKCSDNIIHSIKIKKNIKCFKHFNFMSMDDFFRLLLEEMRGKNLKRALPQ